MELDTIVNELRVQQQRINAAIVALVGAAADPTPPNSTPTPAMQLITIPMEQEQHRTRTRMTAGVKQKISIAMKRNWESRKRKISIAMKRNWESQKPRFTLSEAVKAKMSASQKARWALIKEVALQANAHAPVAIGGNHATISAAA